MAARFDANGEFHGYRGTGTDVTAIMRAQEEHERLRQLESDIAHMNRLDMMGEQAASLAHRLILPCRRIASLSPFRLSPTRGATYCTRIVWDTSVVSHTTLRCRSKATP